MTTIEWIMSRKVIAIARGLEPSCMVNLAQALYQGGIDLLEVTFNQAKPESWQGTAAAIRAIATHMAGKVLPGAGTVLTPEQLEMARDAGAKYIITPNTNPALIEKAKAAGLGCFPGALTPSEIVIAHNSGADAVKVFPAGQLGPAYIKALRAPLAHIPLMAVGGVHEHNAADFLAAGCVGIGVGGNLVSKAWIDDHQWEKITALAAAYRKAVD